MHLIHANILAGSSKAKGRIHTTLMLTLHYLTLPYLTYIFLPSCCAPARPSISSAPSLKVGPPPLRTFEDRGSCDTTALRKSTCHNPRVTRSTLLACIDLPWRDDTRWPVQTGSALLACLCLPAPIPSIPPSLPPTQGALSIIWYRYRRNLSGAI